MNTLTPMSCNNKPAFGMAFQKPGKEVMQHFREVMNDLKPEGRQTFVSEMGKIVKSNESCPVPIEQFMTKAYSPSYAVRVNGKVFQNADNNITARANNILNIMKTAAKEAEDRANVDANMQDIQKIFNMNA